MSRCRSSPPKNPSWRWRAELRWRRRAPRYDTSTIGLAYSQDPDGTTVYPFFLADDATTFLGHADATEDTADIASDPDDVPERSKPFLVAGSSLATIFVAGMMALTIALVVNVRPTADQDSDDIAVHPGAAAPPPALQDAPPEVAQQLPNTAPAPAPAAPPPAVTATAQLMEVPAPRRREWWCATQRPPPPRHHAHRPHRRRPLCFHRGYRRWSSSGCHRLFSHPPSSTRVRRSRRGAAAVEATAATAAGVGTAAVTRAASH